MNNIIAKLKGNKFFKPAVLALLFVILLFVPHMGIKTVYLRYACTIMMYATLAGSLNIINGYSGQTCLGQAGFFCIGAYTCAILSTKLGMSFWLCLICAGILGALVGFVVSLPTLRLQGTYLSIVTLGSSEIIRIIAQSWTGLTGGAMGIKSIPKPMFFGMKIFKPQDYFYIFLALGVVFLFLSNRVLKSRVGRAWMSIREDQIAARSLGVEIKMYKCTNFMYGAFWAAVVGAAYAPFVSFIEASQFSLDTGFDVLAMVVIGGQGTLIGPIVGATIVTVLTEALRFLSYWRYVIYALIIILMMWVRPQGLVGASNSVLAGGQLRRKVDKKKAGGAKA